MKNLKLLLVVIVIFAAFGFTLITTDNDAPKNQSEAEIATVEIANRFSEDLAVFE